MRGKLIRRVWNALGFTVELAYWDWPERPAEPPFNWRALRGWSF